MTLGGNGHDPGSADSDSFAFSGAPNLRASGANAPGIRRPVAAANTGGWSASGCELAILRACPRRGEDTRRGAFEFGLWSNNLTSITSLREVSDGMQSKLRSPGALVDTAPPLGSLPAPAVNYALEQPVRGRWPGNPRSGTRCPGPRLRGGCLARRGLDRAPSPRHLLGTSFSTGAVSMRKCRGCGRPNHLSTCAWRVRGDAPQQGSGRLLRDVEPGLQEFAAGLLEAAVA